MLKIHHATAAKAEKLGITLVAASDHVTATHHEMPAIVAVDAKAALVEMAALFATDELIRSHDTAEHIEYDLSDSGKRVMLRVNGHDITERHMTPSELLKIAEGIEEFKPADVVEQVVEEVDEDEGVEPEDTITEARARGAADYAKGIFAADCPYDEGTDEFEVWCEAWDEAADEATPNEEEDRPSSVVADKYRALYAEAGHPDNCGDWLAILLEGFCVNKAGTNLELFEAICDMNGVDLSKYSRESRGWQGRLRMTGRNLLARKVFDTGVLALPETLAEGGKLTPPAAWMDSRPYAKPKAAPVTEAE